MKYSGLIVRNGRLINERPNGMTGIQEASKIRREMRREEKVSMIREAVYQAEQMSDLHEELNKKKMG